MNGPWPSTSSRASGPRSSRRPSCPRHVATWPYGARAGAEGSVPKAGQTPPSTIKANIEQRMGSCFPHALYPQTQGAAAPATPMGFWAGPQQEQQSNDPEGGLTGWRTWGRERMGDQLGRCAAWIRERCLGTAPASLR
eukprot:15472914-Alexandrium_andersonii.AAC.1